MSAYLDLVRAHAPLLAVLTPLVGAALALLSPSARGAWVIASAAALLGAVIAGDLALRLLLGGPARVVAVEALSLRADGGGAAIAALLGATGALAALGAGAAIWREFSRRVTPWAMSLLLLSAGGWICAALAGDVITLFIAAQIAWLASVGLAALGGERGALAGALRMLTFGGVASALMLFGASLLARSAGGADLALLANAPIASPGLAAFGAGLMLAALALMAGVAPLHAWTGAAYGRAGGVAVLALGALGAIGALGALMRLAAYAMAAPPVADALSDALLALGMASVVIGSVQAMGARNVRRMAAYAAAAQAGCALVSAALGSPAGFAAALVLLAGQAAGSLALLAGTAGLGEAKTLAALDGLARRAPLSSIAITAGALNLMGAPLTLGFLGRWRLIEAGVGGGWWWSASAVIVASLAGVFYGGRLIERLYFRRAAESVEPANAWNAALTPALAAALAAIAIGLEPSALLRAADAAAALMTGTGP